MTLPAWHEEPVDKRHPWDAFDCGDAALNDFLRGYARKNYEAGGPLRGATILGMQKRGRTTDARTLYTGRRRA